MQITCLHTAKVHIATFQALFDAQETKAQVRHVVRDDLLARAQTDGVAAIRKETRDVLHDLASADAVLCTCSTLGTIIDELADPRFLRVDRPMMDAACQIGPSVLMAICLESTRTPSLAALTQSAADLGKELNVTVHLCDGAWAYFEAGNTAGFGTTIATSIQDAVGGHDCVILAQASMRVAEPLLTDLGIPVLSSPKLAVEATIAQAML